MADNATETPRIVTIDLDDEKQLKALDRAWGRSMGWANAGKDQLRIEFLVDALNLVGSPAKVAEPTLPGAVVRDGNDIGILADAAADRSRWVVTKTNGGLHCWTDWSSFSDAVEILYLGYDEASA